MIFITVTDKGDHTRAKKWDYHLSDPRAREFLYGLLYEAEQLYGPVPASPLETLGNYVTAAACKCFEYVRKLAKALWAGAKYIIVTVEEL